MHIYILRSISAVLVDISDVIQRARCLAVCGVYCLAWRPAMVTTHRSMFCSRNNHATVTACSTMITLYIGSSCRPEQRIISEIRCLSLKSLNVDQKHHSTDTLNVPSMQSGTAILGPVHTGTGRLRMLKSDIKTTEETEVESQNSKEFNNSDSIFLNAPSRKNLLKLNLEPKA